MEKWNLFDETLMFYHILKDENGTWIKNDELKNILTSSNE